MTPARRRERGVVAALAAAATAGWALVPTYPNYDAYYHLVWGRELIHGVTPSFEAFKAPTEHPLYVAWAGLLGLVGEHGDRLLVLTAVLSLVALVWAVWRLGTALFGPWPALAAAAFVGSSFSLLLFAARAYVDLPFLALVVWAAVWEAERPRRGRRVALLLALAGLLRPEAWLLAGLYWLWRSPWRAPRGEALVLSALVAVGPLTWALADLAVTGDPLFSLHSTSELADDLNRDRSVSEIPGLFVSFLADTVRAPVAAAGALGIALTIRLRGWRSGALGLALFVAGAVTFLATGIAGLAVLPRYLTVPAIALALFAGYALLGFTTLPSGAAWRGRWARLSALAALGGVVAVALQAPGALNRLGDELAFGRGTHDDLRALVRAREVSAARVCGPLTFPTYRLVPDARWILDAPRRAVSSRAALRRANGVAVFPLGRKTMSRYGFADGVSVTTLIPDPGFVPIARRGRFSAYAACP